MTDQLFTGFVHDSAGAPIRGASVYLLDRNTTIPIRAATTTDDIGFWSIHYTGDAFFDVQVTSGTKVWLTRLVMVEATMVEA